MSPLGAARRPRGRTGARDGLSLDSAGVADAGGGASSGGPCDGSAMGAGLARNTAVGVLGMVVLVVAGGVVWSAFGVGALGEEDAGNNPRLSKATTPTLVAATTNSNNSARTPGRLGVGGLRASCSGSAKKDPGSNESLSLTQLVSPSTAGWAPLGGAPRGGSRCALPGPDADGVAPGCDGNAPERLRARSFAIASARAGRSAWLTLSVAACLDAMTTFFSLRTVFAVALRNFCTEWSAYSSPRIWGAACVVLASDPAPPDEPPAMGKADGSTRRVPWGPRFAMPYCARVFARVPSVHGPARQKFARLGQKWPSPNRPDPPSTPGCCRLRGVWRARRHRTRLAPPGGRCAMLGA